VFRSLGVFLDGFDVDAVASVADISKDEAAELVEALFAKSLVVRADRNGRVRFRLLETLKAYAEDRLVDADEASDVRSRHLGHFFAMSMANGRSACGGTLGMGRRLRFDVGNVSAAAEYALATGRPDTAAELLTASAMGYFLDIRLPELAELLDRVLAANARADGATADGFDDDLVGCLRATKVWVNVFLANWDITTRDGKTLLDSPDPLHRGLGLAIRSFLSRSADAVEPLASLAEKHLDEGSEQSRRSNVETVARWMLTDARASQALRDGRAQDALDHADKMLEAPTDADDRGYSHVSVATVAATAKILLGHPEQALETIDWLGELDIEYYDGIEIRALAHLALGNLDEARRLIRVHATRGVSGRLHGEAADSVLLLAELARVEGDDALARHLLTKVGLARGHSTMRIAHDLAIGLDIADECTALLERDVSPDADRTKIAARTIAATRSELVRRGWT
jgi:tetratricopeptide (TPR) repeat protein